ncbi:sugar translocase [Bifidobacterium aemilianum]|uniref:Sugar translocase n=1 Tax=Bifidobacterium aemilianum TaxID=2493120 RepID=A0A366K8R0_9BIFI|nr:GtrA family protein [Bifidobacterium aemilianum]RBP97707.1 sugar translocase [Bifidobacterium aemilianum]
MRKLIEQLVKFGVVGLIAFLIDWGVLNLLVIFAHMNSVAAGIISFLVSLAFNYLASMKYVFKHREDMAQWMEVLIFFISAAIGLLINVIILAGFTFGLILGTGRYVLFTNIGKLVSALVVAIWNFVIRKWLLDDTHTHASNRLKPADKRLSRDELDTKWEHSFSHRLGLWSLAHTPKGWR